MARKVPEHFKSNPNPTKGKGATRTIRTFPGPIGPRNVNARHAVGAGNKVRNSTLPQYLRSEVEVNDDNFIPASENPRLADTFQGLLPG